MQSNNIEPNKMYEADLDREIANSPKDHIPGWGVDADDNNNPNYPFKHWNGADYQRFNYPKPNQQPVTVEVLHSNERPGITRVFGTSTPPHGLSGAIRRYAFKHSESTYLHWFPLTVADKINVIEGIVDDLKKCIVPNIFVEKGWKAEWKYNRDEFIKKIAITTLVTIGVIAFLRRRRD